MSNLRRLTSLNMQQRELVQQMLAYIEHLEDVSCNDFSMSSPVHPQLSYPLVVAWIIAMNCVSYGLFHLNSERNKKKLKHKLSSHTENKEWRVQVLSYFEEWETQGMTSIGQVVSESNEKLINMKSCVGPLSGCACGSGFVA